MWTGDEIELLKQYYETKLKEFIREKIKNRTWKAIKKKARGLGLSRAKFKPMPKFTYKEINSIKHKKCNTCKRYLPLNKDYYFKKRKSSGGFVGRCKECDGYKNNTPEQFEEFKTRLK